MKKGSKAIYCYGCGKVVGWNVPTGRRPHGITEVTQRLNKDGNIVDKGCTRYFFCDACNPDSNTKKEETP